MGMQLTDEEVIEFRAFMKELGYRYHEETDNVAYKLFASGG